MNTALAKGESAWVKIKRQCLGANPLMPEEGVIVCPRCHSNHSLGEVVKLAMSHDFANFLAQIYKCPNCGHLFAPVV